MVWKTFILAGFLGIFATAWALVEAQQVEPKVLSYENVLAGAEQGRPEDQDLLGIMILLGMGSSDDKSFAVEWFRKAAEQGYGPSQANLAVAYLEGRGIEQSNTEAAFWFKKAALQGEARAQFGLGSLLEAGAGVPQDYVLSYVWLNIASANGSAEATRARDRVKAKLSDSMFETAQRIATKCKDTKYLDCSH